MAMLINFIAFQASWFAAVLSAAQGIPWAGVLVVAAAVAIHLWRVPDPRAEALLLAACGVAGGAFDSLLVISGWVSYPSGMLSAVLAPYWIVAMWIAFATTLNLSLGWLKGRDGLAILLGAVGGPLAYLTGQKLGGIELVATQPALLALAVGWGLMMPGLTRLAERFDGTRPPRAASRRLVLE